MSTPQAAPPVVRERAEAAAVAAAREEIVRALGPLAASPLNEPAVQRMRRALARADSPAVRAAVRRLRFLVTSPCVNGEMPDVGSRRERARRWPPTYPGMGPAGRVGPLLSARWVPGEPRVVPCPTQSPRP